MSPSEHDPDRNSFELLRCSVVKLFTAIKKPNYFQPWEYNYQDHSGGTACVIGGNLLLTNAHVVSHSVHVEALKAGDPRKYRASVLHIDDDSELAVLTTDDPSFFEGTVPVRFGELPKHNARVTVFGFPIGGNELAVTSGVASRIEVIRYTHSWRSLLAIQTDAALNPGNSGGPVFVDGALVGIAFQGLRESDGSKVGYIIPIPVVQHFLEDLADGAVTGVPELGVYWQRLENEALLRWLQVDRSQGGVLVSRIVHRSSADGYVAQGDVIRAIDHIRVDVDGSAQVETGHRVHFTHLISRRQVGDSVSVTVTRSGMVLDLNIQLKPYRSLVPTLGSRPPEFIVFAGLVFMPLTKEYMASWRLDQVDPRYRHYDYNVLPRRDRQEIVLLSQVLAHEINAGYHKFRGVVVDRVNGTAISRISDVKTALRSPQRGFHVIEVDNIGSRSESSDYYAGYGTTIVLDANQAALADREILLRHGIVSSAVGNTEVGFYRLSATEPHGSILTIPTGDANAPSCTCEGAG